MIIFNKDLKTSLNLSELEKSFKKIWFWNEPPLKRNPNKLVKVITPRPPIWINVKIIPLPIGVNCEAVSTTVNPVTQTALVEVKKASIKRIPFVVEFGSNNRPVPIKIINRKLPAKRAKGLNFNFNKWKLDLDISITNNNESTKKITNLLLCVEEEVWQESILEH